MKKVAASREQLADASALVTYLDGSMLILESDLARKSVLQESRPVNYSEPALPPAGAPKKRDREEYTRMLKDRTLDAWRRLTPILSVPSIPRPRSPTPKPKPDSGAVH